MCASLENFTYQHLLTISAIQHHIPNFALSEKTLHASGLRKAYKIDFYKFTSSTHPRSPSLDDKINYATLLELYLSLCAFY